MLSSLYLQILEIPGSSTNPLHPGWIDVQSYSRTISTPNDLVITAAMDKSIPGLLKYLASGKYLYKARLAICDSLSGVETGGITLTNLKVSKVTESGSRTGQALVNYTLTSQTISTY